MSQLKLGVEQQRFKGVGQKDFAWLVVEETVFFPSKLWVFFSSNFSQKRNLEKTCHR